MPKNIKQIIIFSLLSLLVEFAPLPEWHQHCQHSTTEAQVTHEHCLGTECDSLQFKYKNIK